MRILGRIKGERVNRILLCAVCFCGVIFGESASVVKPIGDIFLNLMFVLIVPLVFFSMTTAIYNMKKSGMVGRLLGVSMLVFLVTSVISGFITAGSLALWNPLAGLDRSNIMERLPELVPVSNGSVADIIVSAFTVPDFLDLFNKSNLLPMIVFSVMLGFAIASVGKAGEKIASALSAGMDITVRMVQMVMIIAPLGLGCYFADIVGKLGGRMIGGYLNVFILFLVLTALIFFIVNTLYVLFAGGRQGVRSFWSNIIPPALTAMATTSSAACIPINIESSKAMGVSSQVASTVIPLGTNLHKDGSVVSGVIKVFFLFALFGMNVTSVGQVLLIIAVSILVSSVIGAIPTGGMTGELLICSIFGFPPEMAAVVMIISTIIDVPATLLNSTGNIVSSILVQKFIPR